MTPPPLLLCHALKHAKFAKLIISSAELAKYDKRGGGVIKNISSLLSNADVKEYKSKIAEEVVR